MALWQGRPVMLSDVSTMVTISMLKRYSDLEITFQFIVLDNSPWKIALSNDAEHIIVENVELGVRAFLSDFREDGINTLVEYSAWLVKPSADWELNKLSLAVVASQEPATVRGNIADMTYRWGVELVAALERDSLRFVTSELAARADELVFTERTRSSLAGEWYGYPFTFDVAAPPFRGSLNVYAKPDGQMRGDAQVLWGAAERNIADTDILDVDGLLRRFENVTQHLVKTAYRWEFQLVWTSPSRRTVNAHAVYALTEQDAWERINLKARQAMLEAEGYGSVVVEPEPLRKDQRCYPEAMPRFVFRR